MVHLSILIITSRKPPLFFVSKIIFDISNLIIIPSLRTRVEREGKVRSISITIFETKNNDGVFETRNNDGVRLATMQDS